MLDRHICKICLVFLKFEKVILENWKTVSFMSILQNGRAFSSYFINQTPELITRDIDHFVAKSIQNIQIYTIITLYNIMYFLQYNVITIQHNIMYFF